MPCSDLSARFATNAAVTGLVSSTVGPKRSPLGLSADPGGLPLYKNGEVVGGIGVESDGIYTLDGNVLNYDKDPDELIALAGHSLFPAPDDIVANRIFVEGKALRFSDARLQQLQTNPGSASFAAVNGTLGNLTSVTGYYTAAAAPLAGQAFGTIASGVAADNTGTFNFVGDQVFFLYDGAGNPRFPPVASTTPTPTNAGGTGLTANEVTTIIGNALKIAFAGRAQIRRPLRRHIQVTVSVVAARGNVLDEHHSKRHQYRNCADVDEDLNDPDELRAEHEIQDSNAQKRTRERNRRPENVALGDNDQGEPQRHR